MKKRMTITVDADLIPVAKEYARLRGVSLSSLVERSLREVVADNEPSFASRWRGKFQPAERDDSRYEALSKKYLQ